MRVGLFAVIAHVHTQLLVAPGDAQRHHEGQDLEYHECPHATVCHDDQHAGRLDQYLRRVTSDQAVRAAAPRRIRKHAGQDRSGRAAKSVRGHHVE